MTTWLKLLLGVAIVLTALALTFWLRPPRELPIPGEAVALAPAPPLLPSATEDAGPAEYPASVPDPSPLSEALCPPGMAWVADDYCPAGFDGKRGCRVPTLRVGACVDLHEYPNQPGVLPASMSTFAEAEEACLGEGKRLCRDSEWTAACRGTLALAGCWFGQQGPLPDIDRLYGPATRSEEVRRVDRRRVSGPSSCVSESGVFDLPGNLAEWVRAGGSGGYDGALKGGHFNKGSIGCERSLFTHELKNRSPFVGFRCCREPLVEPPQSSSSGF